MLLGKEARLFYSSLIVLSFWVDGINVRQPKPHRRGQTSSLAEVRTKQKKHWESNSSAGASTCACTRSCSCPGVTNFWSQICSYGFQERTAQPPRDHPPHDTELKHSGTSPSPVVMGFGVQAHPKPWHQEEEAGQGRPKHQLSWGSLCSPDPTRPSHSPHTRPPSSAVSLQGGQCISHT